MNDTTIDTSGLSRAEQRLSGVGRLRAVQVAVVAAIALALVALTAWGAYQLIDAERRQMRSEDLQRDLTEMRDDASALEMLFWRKYSVSSAKLDPRDFAPTLEIRARIQELARREQDIDPDGPGVRLAERTLAAMDEIITVGTRYLTAPAGERQRIIRDLLASDPGPLDEATSASQEWMRLLLARSRDTAARQTDRTIGLLVRVAGLIVLLVAVAVVGYVMLGRARARLVEQLHGVALEQSALRRVAMEVAEQRDANALFAVLAAEMVRLLDADAGFVCRCERDVATILGALAPPWLDPVMRDQGTREITPDSAIGRALRTGGPVRLAGYADVAGPLAAALHQAGIRTAVAAPVLVAGSPWGAIVALSRAPDGLPQGVEERLAPFARLAGVAIENSQGRAQLAQRATTDALTNLPNHGAFHERLAAEEHRCADDPDCRMALIVLDIDHFKAVNDMWGHPMGDRVLVEVADRLRALIRGGEMVARVGGEEFGWILPGTDADGATAAAERARAAVSDTPFDVVGTLTLSAGICDRQAAPDPAQMFHLADAALLYAKANGRDRAVRFDPLLIDAGDAGATGRHLERVRTLDALRALARAVDARDRATQQHSQRVADLTHRLARRLGWDDDRARSLREAALVHDVGKIGVADAVLRKGTGLTADEQAQMEGHAVLGARIVSEVLSSEQVAWVRGHHERMDGRGYPDGLAGGDIPEGARILAVADAWDAMTTDRPYRAAMDVGTARERVMAMCGDQLDPGVAHALIALVDEAPRRGPVVGSGGAGR